MSFVPDTQNKEFQDALNLIQYTRQSVFLTGKAGTGKSTFLKYICANTKKKHVVLAPTGIAAINAGGSTLHSFFKLPFYPLLPDDPNFSLQRGRIHEFFKYTKPHRKLLEELELVIIDEISMVRADIIDAVDRILRVYSRNLREPFGGKQILLVGDVFQLEPVVKGDEREILNRFYPTPYFFSARVFGQIDLVSIELQKVYRQTDSKFIHVLDHIRNNTVGSAELQLLNTRYGTQIEQSEADMYITLATRRDNVDYINDKKLAELPGQPYTFSAEINNDFPEYSYPTDDKLILKCGAQVMFVKNDSSSEKRYYNGKIGKIVFINPNKITVVDREGNEIVVEKEIWNNVKYTIDPETKEITETITGTFSQYPLKTAWAITIHKSQGLTFEHAIIDASAAFSHGQVYVALSRCKTLEGLVLSSQITRNAMINDYRIQEFTSSVNSRQPREEQMQAAQQLYFTELICELFDFNNLQQRIQYAAFVVYGNLQKLYPELSVQYSNTRDAFRSTVTDVGERFIQQLKRLITGNTDYLKDETIQERVRKGVAYFLEQIDRLCTPLQEASNVEIDNKETRKTIKNALDKWNEDLRIKLSTLQGCQDGFTISGYLSAKAKASIEQPSVPTTRKRSEKSSEPAKLEISTDIKHPELYANLKRWRYEVATEKGLPTYTILQQKALIGVANTLPANGRDLLKIPGIGKKIVENYGAKLLEIVDDYRQGL